MNELFRKIAHSTSFAMGAPATFVLAVGIIVLWAVSGPFFEFSDTWQLFINTGTTVLTFLMVFLIQNTQNRDSHAIQLKLDEIIRALKPARDDFIDIEDDDDATLDRLDKELREHKKQQVLRNSQKPGN
ncbi:MAG: putative membrane protein [Parcubacteria bacterium C7867-001]|nr:MAG: putative membrane protein [Parcubacteria bacterium C7867-001]